MDDTPPYRAYLCCGPRCALRNSTRLVGVLAGEVARQGLDEQVAVLPGGCMKHCESGPTLTIWPGPVYYEGVTPERLKRIVAQHFGRDQPVAEYIWRDPLLPRHDRPRPPQHPMPTPHSTAPPKKPARPVRPAWQRNAGEVDDFKW